MQNSFLVHVALLLLGLGGLTNCGKSSRGARHQIQNQSILNLGQVKPFQISNATNLFATGQMEADAFVSIQQRDMGNGKTLITFSGAKKYFFTFDGTLPKFENDTALGTALVYEQPFVVDRATIIRAVGVLDGKVSAIRSAAVLPTSHLFKFTSLPNGGKKVANVAVTGSFRNWSTAFDAAYLLAKKPDGSFERSIALQRNEDVQYKFIVQYTSGEMFWYVENNAPQISDGEHTNNFLPSAVSEIASKYLAKTDGFIDETAVSLGNVTTAVDRVDDYVRLRMNMLDGDAQSVNIVFEDGTNAPLTKKAFETQTVGMATYSILFKLPPRSQRMRYFFLAKDNGKNIGIGPSGIFVLSSENSAIVPSNDYFNLDFDSAQRTINGVDIDQIPLWSIDTVWYQIFPERFRNGDLTNDEPAAYPLDWNLALSDLNKIKQTVTPWNSSWFTFSPIEKQTRSAVLNAYPNMNVARIEAQIIRNRRYGGDLRGVLNAIPYLKSLGITGVYFNPIFAADSEHKYDTNDYRHVDQHFGPMKVLPDGTKAVLDSDMEVLAREVYNDASTWGYTSADREFMQLVQELHANGIRVVIDGVFNHSGIGGPLARDVAMRGKSSPYYNWFTTSYEGDADYNQKVCQLSKFYADPRIYPYASKIRYTAWEEPACNLINHRQGFEKTVFHPGMHKYFMDVVERWLKPKMIGGMRFDGIDGIRLDVYDLVDAKFWQDFRRKVKSIKPNALIVAENWMDGYELLRGDQADSLMNYRVRTLTEAWFMNTNRREKMTPSHIRSYVEERLQNHRENVKYGLWSMLSSHDTDRVLSRTILQNRGLAPQPLNGNSWDDALYNKPDLGAKYSNDRPGNEERQFFKVITAFQMAFTGAPVIYYGDEVGMWGADDPTCRKPMIWEDIAGDTQFETQCTQYAGLFCKENPDVRFVVKPDGDLFATYSRFVHARNANPALRRGLLNTDVELKLSGHGWMHSGDPAIDNNYIWAFERAFDGREFAYFVSNQNLDVEKQTFAMRTNFAPGTRLVDLITNAVYVVDRENAVVLTLARDRGALLVREGTQN